MTYRSPQERDLLTPAEVAARFRVSNKTIIEWAKSGKLSYVRTIGGHRRYFAAEVNALLTDPSGTLLKTSSGRIVLSDGDGGERTLPLPEGWDTWPAERQDTLLAVLTAGGSTARIEAGR